MEKNEEKVRVQDDLFQYVNGEWLESAVIPNDRPNVGGFADLDTGVEKLMMGEFADWNNGKNAVPNPVIGQAVALYRKALNVEERNTAGVKPVLPRLAFIEKLNSFETVNEHLYDIFTLGYPHPFSMGVDTDAKDTQHHCLALSSPNTILPDTSYYADDNENGKRLLDVWAGMARKLLALIPGLSSEEAEKKLQNCLAFDREISKRVKSQLEWADYIKAYNPYSFEDVCAKLVNLDFEGLVKKVFGFTPKKVIVADPRFLEEFGLLWNNENIKLYADWAYVRELVSTASYLSEECREIAHDFKRATSGVVKPVVPEKFAYRLADNVFSQPIGVFYGHKYFGADAKADVESICHDIIEVYKSRITTKEWLSPATRERAILKLKTMVLKIGFPEKVSPVYDLYKVDESKSLLDNIIELNRVNELFSDSLLDKDVDRELWVMPAHMVNACYNPTSNDLTFPAAILQAPFYSFKQSRAENLGGIGAVIGHEISHAFDNNGAQCDENGNINNWWTDSDYAAFKEKTKAMIEEFDKLPMGDGEVSGELIVSENIADNGGFGAALDAASREGITDLKPFFYNWGKIWRMKATPEYTSLLLKVDVHAPNYWRANMQPRNFDEWYTTFDVKPTDKMYLAPEKRVRIW